jgi:alkanesulfonate monooxygenase SsuD/methylene tetrahydromethanopterin reductase-like flavin-dependent oxidoreductase (luciferase family)
MYKEAIEEAVYAEAVGFNAYCRTEHHFYTEIGHRSAPEMALAAISQRTDCLRLGLGVVVLPCNRSFRVPEYVSHLDAISGGRAEFGTGRGASPCHVVEFGYSSSESSSATAYASGSIWSRASCQPSIRPSSSRATPASLAAWRAPAVASVLPTTATAG